MSPAQGTSWLSCSVARGGAVMNPWGTPDAHTGARSMSCRTECLEPQQLPGFSSPCALVCNQIAHLVIKMNWYRWQWYRRRWNKTWNTLYLANSFSKLHFSCAFSCSFLFTCPRGKEKKWVSVGAEAGATSADAPCVQWIPTLPIAHPQKRGHSGSLWGKADVTNSPAIRKTRLHVRPC